MQTGRIHLCQPDSEKSCGACCGLYNWKNHSREALQSILSARTDAFMSRGSVDDLDAYRGRIAAFSPGLKLCETIYNCEFLGFVDEGHKRVGCMLHPSLNGGADLRTCSHYGAELCANHFCIGFTCLSDIEQQAVIQSVQDWYLYGLVITDIDLVKSFFAHAANRMGDCVRRGPLADSTVQAALRGFFKLKEHWKFMSKQCMLGKYYFSEGEYHCARIDYEKRWGIRRSPFDRILISLASDFTSADELEEAETIIEKHLQRFIDAYGAALRGG
jgi:hypothetical protein